MPAIDAWQPIDRDLCTHQRQNLIELAIRLIDADHRCRSRGSPIETVFPVAIWRSLNESIWTKDAEYLRAAPATPEIFRIPHIDFVSSIRISRCAVALIYTDRHLVVTLL
jgi:hypothetical protein